MIIKSLIWLAVQIIDNNNIPEELLCCKLSVSQPRLHGCHGKAVSNKTNKPIALMCHNTQLMLTCKEGIVLHVSRHTLNIKESKDGT